MIKFGRLQLTLALAAAFLASAVGAIFFFTDRGAEVEPAQENWQPVTTASQLNELATSGKLSPVQMIEISSPAAGVIASLAVEMGDAVVKGQTLGRIESPELDAQLRTSQAALLRSQLQDGFALAGEEPAEVLGARRRLLTSQTALKTTQMRQQESSALFRKGFISRNEDEAAITEVQNAEQQVTLAQEDLKAAMRKFSPDQLRALKLEIDNKHAELAQLRERQKKLTLVSPLTGVILSPQAQESRNNQAPKELVAGARLAAGDGVLAIGDTSSFIVRGFCSEADSAWLETGADVEVTIASLPDQTFSAKVTKVRGQAQTRRSGMSGDEVTYEFQVAFPAPGQTLTDALRRKLQVGGTAKLKIVQKSNARLTSIPLAAVVWAPNGGAQVRWRASATAPAEMRTIHILRSGLTDVLVSDELEGEVWVAGDSPSHAPETSSLKRMFGFEDE